MKRTLDPDENADPDPGTPKMRIKYGTDPDPGFMDFLPPSTGLPINFRI